MIYSEALKNPCVLEESVLHSNCACQHKSEGRLFASGAKVRQDLLNTSQERGHVTTLQIRLRSEGTLQPSKYISGVRVRYDPPNSLRSEGTLKHSKYISRARVRMILSKSYSLYSRDSSTLRSVACCSHSWHAALTRGMLRELGKFSIIPRPTLLWNIYMYQLQPSHDSGGIKILQSFHNNILSIQKTRLLCLVNFISSYCFIYLYLQAFEIMLLPIPILFPQYQINTNRRK